MKRANSSSLVFLASLFLNGCLTTTVVHIPSVAERGSNAAVPSLSRSAAKRLLIETTNNPHLRFTNDGIIVGAGATEPTLRYVDFTDIMLVDETYHDYFSVYLAQPWQQGQPAFHFSCDQKAAGVDAAKALYALRYYYVWDRTLATEPSADFVQMASQYRALVTKPTLPESIHRFQVQANAAFGEKNYDDAIDLYEQGVQELPTWSQGHFNAALLLGENERYREAILHMKMYLGLSPNASDAAAARDKIYEWERKAADATPKKDTTTAPVKKD